MVAPFLGCTFGGFLYDLMLFTGDSPINMPYMGLYRFIPGIDKSEYENTSWDPIKGPKRHDEEAEAASPATPT